MIGFRPTEYSAFENQGAINFTIELISGQLRVDVPFHFSTADIASPATRAEGERERERERGFIFLFLLQLVLTIPLYLAWS